MSSRGRLITLEGGEGVGKSTNMAAIAATLAANSIDYIETREPGGTELAESIRNLLLQPRNAPGDEAMPPIAELLLMFAARAVHVHNKIEPALAAGQWVLCDRFIDASYAYQGAARQLDVSAIQQLQQLVLGDLVPDLTVLLDADPSVGRDRIANREADRFEQEQQAFFQAVRECYQQRAAAEPERIKVVDASQPLEQVKAATVSMVEHFIEAQRQSVSV